ncbi:MAG: stage V sporulation protein AD [Clostridia bacterium]|nr:stage V sporulation protein AD [Clostridia bacterium]
MRRGDTVFLDAPVYVRSHFACVGKKEGEGPLGACFDYAGEDNIFGQDTWEKAESEMLRIACRGAMDKGGLRQEDVGFLLGGDLMNQCTATSYAVRGLGLPFLGLYGACSTMAETLLIGGLLIAGGFAENVLCTASSHFCTAERQYRYPLEYGGQRQPSAQWTATAAGAVALSSAPAAVRISAVTAGRVYDPGVTDAGNMGAAMAQAAYETLHAYFRDSGDAPADFDMIATGDLAEIGSALVRRLFAADGADIGSAYTDCGLLLYGEEQDAHAGASGCGCSASVLCGHILPMLERGELRRALFCGTGALLSPLMVNQGESIPGICHLVCLEAVK